MLSWIRNFLAINGKGYDNSRLSDNIHRRSREIHDKWYPSLAYLISKWTCNENLSQASTKKIFPLVLYEVLIEISTALHSVIYICK